MAHLSTFEFGGRIFELWRQIWTLLGTNMQQISIVGHSREYIGLSSEALMSSKLKPAKLACPPNSNIVKCAQVDSGWYWEPAFALGVHMGVQKCLKKIIIFLPFLVRKCMISFPRTEIMHSKKGKRLSACVAMYYLAWIQQFWVVYQGLHGNWLPNQVIFSSRLPMNIISTG